jgi:hypothetical protein
MPDVGYLIEMTRTCEQCGATRSITITGTHAER